MDGTIQKVSNAVRDNIKPDITMFLRYEIKDIEQKSILAVHITFLRKGCVQKEFM